jgi:hypothetical protein
VGKEAIEDTLLIGGEVGTPMAQNADYETNTTSGIGMVRNYNGGSGPSMPELYGSQQPRRLRQLAAPDHRDRAG